MKPKIFGCVSHIWKILSLEIMFSNFLKQQQQPNIYYLSFQSLLPIAYMLKELYITRISDVWKYKWFGCLGLFYLWDVLGSASNKNKIISIFRACVVLFCLDEDNIRKNLLFLLAELNFRRYTADENKWPGKWIVYPIHPMNLSSWLYVCRHLVLRPFENCNSFKESCDGMKRVTGTESPTGIDSGVDCGST
jgi:hypothetical protein